ncbi:glycosyltransferase domain-containing protein [Confluentibacter citreus]|uniref:glycosyltransferase domain-containing protein n=1 Tax=Confluentibacter citreus TaxID=2007307 RepID=UPI000C284200|nr:glycosyltransferase domain-containing protein [Confluentibacter citreus]
MSIKIAIYTAVFGGKDELKEPLNFKNNENIDYFIISDDKGIKSKCYNLVYKKPIYDDITKNARYYKIIGLEEFKSYDFIIWHDANLQIVQDEILKIITFVDNKGVGFFKHSERNCIYDEAIKCIQLEKDYPLKILKQIYEYYKKGIKNEMGIYETGLFVRNNKLINRDFINFWWKEIKMKSKRDQISLPYALKKFDIVPAIIEGNVRNNSYSVFHKHNYRHSTFLRKKLKTFHSLKKKVAIKCIYIIKKINK